MSDTIAPFPAIQRPLFKEENTQNGREYVKEEEGISD